MSPQAAVAADDTITFSKTVGESDLGDVVMVSMVRPDASTPAAAAIAAGLTPPKEPISWPRVLLLGNLIGIPLLVVAFFVWRRMTQ